MAKCFGFANTSAAVRLERFPHTDKVVYTQGNHFMWLQLLHTQLLETSRDRLLAAERALPVGGTAL